MQQFSFTIIILIGIMSCTTLAKSNEDKILSFLEELRPRMCHPIPKLGLPALDPLQISGAAISINNAYFKNFKASMQNFKMIGLSDFIVHKLKLPGLFKPKFELDFSLPLTEMSMKYNATGTIVDIITLEGDDNFNGRANDLRIQITGSAKIGTKLRITNLKISIKIAEIYVDFGQLVPDDRVNGFIHSLINNVGIELMDEFWSHNEGEIESQIEKAINEKVADLTLKDILQIIVGSGEPIFEPEKDPLPDCKESAQPNVVLVH